MSTDADSDGTGHPPASRRARSDADLARLVFAAIVTVGAFALSAFEPTSARSFSADLINLVNRLPPGAARFVVGVIQLGALAAPIVLMVVALRTRLDQFVLAIVTGAVAGGLAAVGIRRMGDAVPSVIVEASHEPSWVIGSGFPSAVYLAALCATGLVLTRHLGMYWRRLVGWLIAVIVVSRVLTGVDSVFQLASAIALGVAVASAALYAVGFPPRRPRRADITDTLEADGFDVAEVSHLGVAAADGPTYRAETDQGPLLIKVSGADARDADVFARIVRWFRVKGIEDDRPLDPRFAMEHEALNLVLADRAGANVAGVAATGTVGATGDSYLAVDWVAAHRLSELSETDLGDEVLAAAFGQLARLHHARIAHRRAGLEHFRIRTDRTVACTGLGWAERAATDRSIALDNAELLVSSATIVGADRAVAVAHRALGDTLADTLPLLQPLALSPSTRRRAAKVDGLLSGLRTGVQEATGAEEYQLEPLRRVTLRTLLTFVATLVIGNLLLGLVANWSEIWEALRGSDPVWIPLALVLVALTYVTGAMSMMGAVNERLSFGRTSLIMLAQSFLNRFTPANAGGMALRVRYLQRTGIDTVVAGGSVALTSLASGVMQVLFTIVFFAWAGSSAERDDVAFSLPSGTLVLVVIAVLLAVAGAVLFTAFGQKMWGRAKASAVTMLHGLGPLARQPGKLALLFGGAFLGKLIPVLILAQSLAAFGVQIDFAQLGAMYIVATTVASASPTPGGVGAIEAALTAGLVGLGIDSATAAAVVLYFRFITYWFPILPSWLGFRFVQRSDMA